MYTPKEILESIKALEILESLADKCDSEYERNPESEEAEKAFDNAYKAQWEQTELCAQMIHEYSMKSIDMKIARKLISKQYRGKLLESISA